MYQDNLLNELIVDNFAGGGGASIGIELALGRPVDIAVNHDQDAIAMHSVNHPYTQHYQEDVFAIDPVAVTGGRPVALAWFSPDCKHFSKAKGGKPVEKKIRGLAWIALRWAAKVRPRVIMLENVEEFVDWGPCVPKRERGRIVKRVLTAEGEYETVRAAKGEITSADEQIFYPDPKRKGETFKRFISQLSDLGYATDWRILRACDYGAPTIRKRLYLIARCDGEEIAFPEPTHGEGKVPYRTAAECIDMSAPCPSIFERKRPLAVNTLRRIARGLKKFVIENPKPYIMEMNFDNAPQDMEKPLSTVTAIGKHFVVNPSIVPVGYGERKGQQPRVQDMQSPLSTVVSSRKQNLVAPSLIQYHTETRNRDARGQSVDRPIDTIDAAPRYGLSAAYLTKYFSGEKQSGADLNEPNPTVTAIDHSGLVSVHLTSRHGDGADGRGKRVDEPAPTLTAECHEHLVAANIVHYYGGADHASAADSPLPTVTVEPRHYLCESHLCVLRKNTDCKSLNEPLPTLTTSPGHMAQVVTYLAKIDTDRDLGHWAQIRDLLNTYAGYTIAEDEILLFEIDGIGYFINDVGMRMLKAEELKLAQGFPVDYIIDIEQYIGKKYSEQKQIARLGNAVCPPVPLALVRANLAEIAYRQILHTVEELNAAINASVRGARR